MTRARGLGVVAFVALVACVPPRRSSVGVECEVNSECDAPLVCRLGHCRNECATSADCAAGLSCVLDAQRLGACQLPAETSCTVASECPAGLVCRFTQCTNDCETDRDCPGGARCEMDADGLACIDRSGAPCTFDEECDPLTTGERCLAGRCRRECFSDRDCRNDFWCDEGQCTPPPRVVADGGAASDGGSEDAGAVDTGAVDVGSEDGGMRPSLCGGARLTNVVALDASETLTCAVVSGASPGVVCWGSAPLFRRALFGDVSPVPCARTLGGALAEDVAVAGPAACLLAGGEVSCLGWDAYGQLGNGAGQMDTSSPGLVTGPTGITSITGGGLGTFIAWNVGGGFGWGRTVNGSIGDGSSALGTRETATPVTAFTGNDILGLEIGEGNTCAILDVGGVPTSRCIGRGFVFGDGGGPMLIDASDLAVGSSFGCAVTLTGASCWGQGFSGELGDGMLHDRATPGPVPLPGTAVEVDAGDFHACARLDTGEVYCWGRSAGFDPTFFPAVPLPDPQLVFRDATSVRCGAEHTCIITTTGGVQCIGLDTNALGHGPTAVPTAPLDVYRE